MLPPPLETRYGVLHEAGMINFQIVKSPTLSLIEAELS